MQRRLFLCTIPVFCVGLSVRSQPATPVPANRRSTLSDFDAALAQAVASATIDSSRAWRELDFRDRDLTETQTSMAGRQSLRTIDPRAINLIVSCEISSRSRYEKLYKKPVWPGGQSGVTIGIGYDLGFVRPRAFADHWKDLLTSAQIQELSSACGTKGKSALKRLASLQHIRIAWSPADQQFRRFLPFVVAETENAFPNTSELSDVSLGALVSLVYNRGSDTDPDNLRRIHMYRCKEAMKNRQFDAIPGHIRAMKELWRNEKGAQGLLVRRELEAKLFEAGLS